MGYKVLVFCGASGRDPIESIDPQFHALLAAEQLEVLSLEDLSAADVWRRDNRANRVDVRVPLTMVGALNASTDVTLMEMLIPNVEQLVAQQRARRTGAWSYAHSLGERKAGRPDPFFDE